MFPAWISMHTLYLHQGCSLLMLAWDCVRQPASLIQASAAECLQSCGATALTSAVQASASVVDRNVMKPTASQDLKGPAGAPLPPAEYMLCYKA